MKVLWFINSPSLASDYLNLKSNAAGWIESLQKEIIKNKGVELGVAFPFGTEGENRFEIENTKYFSFPYPKIERDLLGFWDRWMHRIETEDSLKYYLRIVNEFNPDIIHIFGTESPYGLMIPLVKVPTIIQIQGNLTVYVKKWFSGIDNYDIISHSNLKTIIKAYGLWHLSFLFKKRALREQLIMKNCSYFIGRTDWDRRVTRVLSPGSKYFHCDELLRSDFHNSKRWINPDNKRKILVSTLSPMSYKGIETILESAHLLKQNKLIDIEWHVVGITGNEEIIQIIEKTYKLKFADQGVKFLGNLNPNPLVEELLGADCYIHPSHIENSPNSVCEAMLIGIPVIATYAGGTPSLITNEVEGLLVQDGDPYSLSGAIVELCNNEKLKETISVNASKKALKRHDPEIVISDLLLIYDSVLLDYKG
jgi:glycosyltransferase involved in cell wall biosynthesis